MARCLRPVAETDTQAIELDRINDEQISWLVTPSRRFINFSGQTLSIKLTICVVFAKPYVRVQTSFRIVADDY